MDEEWHVCTDEAHPLLQESGGEFSVIACVGAQGAGKSTALSLLLSCFRGLLSCSGGADATGSGDEGAGAESDFEPPLGVHSQQAFVEGAAAPPGVDLCVSPLDRLLLLDTQPLFCCESDPDAELKSELYLLIFLTSICHTLLVVMDTQLDVQLLRFLRLLATLKAKVPDLAAWMDRHGEGGAERPAEDLAGREALPRLVVAFNHFGPDTDEAELFGPARTFLERTAWKGAPSVQFVRIPTLPGRSLGEMLTSDAATCAGMRLREALLAAGSERGRFGRAGLQLSEREWLRQAGGYWDFVQKAPQVQDYFNLIAKGLDSYGWPN